MSTPTSRVTMSQKLTDWHENPPERASKELLEKILIDSSDNRKLRSPNKNSLLGIILSMPVGASNERILGVSYYDKKEDRDNEDLFLISGDEIKPMKPLEIKREYPGMYREYHKETKDIFRPAQS